MLGVAKPLRILCTREVQRSIKDSVLRLLSDQVQTLGYGGHYECLASEIRGRNGTVFIFSGLADQTVESIKSFEGIDIVWCEEAQAISKRSWDILTPTIRKTGSEIWISYNPELESDPTHQRFTVHAPDDCVSVLLNYQDNPWFPEVLEKERLRCKDLDPLNYENIWEGMCKPAVVGAIYYHEIAKAEYDGQICNLPIDPLLKTHVVVDLGWNDSMSIALVQRLRSEIRIVEYIEDNHRTLDSYSAQLKDMALNWGKMYLPHDGKHKDVKTGKSAGEILERLGWEVDYTDGLSIEEGIRLARLIFGQAFFSLTKAARLVECLKRYRRQVNKTTNEAGAPLHDEYSHGADCFRYIAINADKMTNDVPVDNDWRRGNSSSKPSFRRSY